MSRAFKAAALYFAIVFGAGFLLGIARVLWVAPRLGPRAAELLEVPFMLAVTIMAARWVVRRLALEPKLGTRLGMGLGALALVLACDFTAVLWLRDQSLRSYFFNLDPISAAAYYGALAVFALVPLFAPPAVARRRRAYLGSTLAVLAAGVAVIYASYHRDLAVERARVASGSSMADTACGPIEYAALGEGPAVLVVHGAGGGYDQMLDTARELAAGGFRVVTMSRFGYLRTPLPADASPQAQADAHACLLDALKIERAAVLGVSAGGPSSMQFALRHPQRTTALVLLVPLAYPARSAERLSPVAAFMVERTVQSDFLYWAAMSFYPDLVVGTILGTPPDVLARAPLDERARLQKIMRQILPLSLRSQGLLNEAKIAASLGRYDLERIAAPTLVISLEDDGYGTYAGARYTAEHVPGARFIGYESGGHMLVGHNAEATAEIRNFLGAPPLLGMVR